MDVSTGLKLKTSTSAIQRASVFLRRPDHYHGAAVGHRTKIKFYASLPQSSGAAVCQGVRHGRGKIKAIKTRPQPSSSTERPYERYRHEGTFELNDELLCQGAADNKAPPTRSSGKTIGNCSILEKINEGGTALIYKAHNTPSISTASSKSSSRRSSTTKTFSSASGRRPAHRRLDHPMSCVFSTREVTVLLHRNEYITGRRCANTWSPTPRSASATSCPWLLKL